MSPSPTPPPCSSRRRKLTATWGADAFADAHNVWWDVTAWQSRAQIEIFMNTEPHLGTRGLADHLCDEASFVDWEQDSATLPDWQTSWRRLVADGRSAPLATPSDANLSRAFPAPVAPPASVT